MTDYDLSSSLLDMYLSPFRLLLLLWCLGLIGVRRQTKHADWAGERSAFQVEDRRKLTWKLPNCVEPMAN